jgi:hypothetical protein
MPNRFSRIFALILIAQALSFGMGKKLQLKPQIEIRVMSFSWTSITQSNSFKAEMSENGRIRIIIPKLTFQGDSISVRHLDKLLDKCGMVLLTIEVPNVDDTIPVFECLRDLGPIQVCTVLQIGTVEIEQEAVISNVRYVTDRLIAFNIDLFNDARLNLVPKVRASKILEVELCGTDVTILDVPKQ